MRNRRVLPLSVVLIVLACTVLGCAFDPSEQVLPGTGARGGTYELRLEFDSVLSLPAGAQVRSGGVRVGALRAVELGDDAVTARVAIADEVRVPAGTRAELRRTTVLGDIHIALIPPADAAGARLLGDGDTIGSPDTESGPQPEDMLARIATFVNGGSTTRLQDALARLGTALPADPAETRQLAGLVATEVAGAAGSTAEIGRILAATEQMSVRLTQMRDEVGFIFSETARRRLDQVPEFMTAVLNVVIDVETLTTGLDWLIPRMPHLNTQLEQLAVLLREPSPHATELRGNAGLAAQLAQTELVPFLRDPRVNLRSVSLSADAGPAVDALVVLRMIGAVP